MSNRKHTKSYAKALAVALGLVLAVAPVGCKKPTRGSPSEGPAGASSARARPPAPAGLRGRPKSEAELRTTSGPIYLENLEGQIKELERLTGEAPHNLALVARLSSLHHTHGRITGDVNELQLGVDIASRCVTAEPDDAKHYLLRAEQAQSLHRFKESRADLERARKLGGADVGRIAGLETELDYNDGRYDRAIAAIRKARHDKPSSHTWLREAQLEHALGESAKADVAFEAAEDLITDTSPLEVSHLYLQRGIVLAARGRLEDACVFFRASTARLPAYIAPREHLAEALAKLGKKEEATKLYEAIVASSSDPEFLHALAELRDAAGKKEEARALEARARSRYETLLTKYPEAMYWHASEFYLSLGDTKKALALLKANVALRPNSESYVALARAELANGHVAEAKMAIDLALAMPLRSASLSWTASRVYRRAGDVAAADAHRHTATRLNPRIEADEPPVR